MEGRVQIDSDREGGGGGQIATEKVGVGGGADSDREGWGGVGGVR